VPRVAIDGAEIYYETAGSGPALLFIHGMCGDAHAWAGQVERLAPHFHCVTYDRRGHTRSELGQIEQRTVELHADDAAALIEALGLAPCLLVGSSGGARVGLDVVRRYPHLLAGAVLSEPPAFALAPDGGQRFVAELKPLIEHAMASGGPRAAVDAFFDYVCPGLWQRLDSAGREPYRANHRELFGDLQMPPYRVTAADLQRIDVPCLILSGEQSHPMFRQIARTLAEHIPNAALAEFANCGHVTYAEQPEAFASAVIDFARRLDIQAPAAAASSR
jgi:pimeloyl-ACP methyl ester carboxylesterase